MHIKSIFVDGFKSYAKRTEIAGFDPAFNAITGLNGSGKSNILDAICFLLGITNLSQDLVYKSGQAGITKATVSIVFDNHEKACSPIGYENFDELTITRQIVIGGKNKYLINGITAGNNRVQDLFRSVQLNVNNPHFLIMQGRITKIMSLLEEAANTKHYEAKREDTLRTIEKKDVKLREIDKILREDIKPTLEKLKEERSSYLEYQKVVRDLEYLNKFVVAYDYTNKKAIVDNSEGELQRMKQQHDKEERIIAENDTAKVNFEHSIDSWCEERDNVHMVKRDDMETQLSELLKTEAILKNSVGRADDDQKEARQALKGLEKQSKQLVDGYQHLTAELEQLQPRFEEQRAVVQKWKTNTDNAQQRLVEANCGFVQGGGDGEAGDGVARSLAEILAAAEHDEAQLDMRLNVLCMKRDHHGKIARQLEQRLHSMIKKESAAQEEREQRQLRAEIGKIDQRMRDTGWSEDQWQQLQVRTADVNAAHRRAANERQDFMCQNRRFMFEYTRPAVATFDERKIHGMIAALVRVEDPQFRVAIEIAAGGRLFNVVLQDAETAVHLFEGNCLRNRTTLLPLDKMQYQLVPDRVLQRAQEIVGADNVWTPMDIISFDKRYYGAVAYVFGGFLIARDMEMAKVVAFNEQVRCRCVTLDGEILDPEGTLVGGSTPPDTGSVFDTAQQLANIEQALQKAGNDKKDIEKDSANFEKSQAQYRSLEQVLREKQIALSVVERRMAQDDYLEIQKAATDIQAELGSINEEIRTTEELHTAAKIVTAEALNNMKNSASVKEKAQKAAEANWHAAQEQLNKAEEAFKEVEFRYESLMVESDNNQEQTKVLQASIIAASKKEVDVSNKLEESNAKLAQHNEETASFKAELEAQKRTLQKLETTIVQARESVKECIKTRDQAALRLSDIVHRITCHRKDSEDAEIKLAKMLKKYLWIAEESQHFNEAGSIYDFSARDWRQAEENIAKLEEQKRRLARKVDLRGMNMLVQTEDSYNRLMDKYEKVIKDKQMLHNVIDGLDKLKVDVIKKAHEQVDRDFNKIFSTLLPGSQARLIPPEGKQLSDGLEFKIAFGNVWKDSLNELSGGQRSLVALSLILALLRFKPAPLYILDEVDAALDISHTNNIGTLIKEQFSNSQFIIVSLKDGMFNNANVLFKTKFVDGVSTVSRHVNVARRPMAEKNN